MDIRENAIRNIMNYVISNIPNKDKKEYVLDEFTEKFINVIKDALIIELNQYEMQNRCTEVAVLDNSNENYLKKFKATKRVAGLSESTIDRYYDMNTKLIDFINKPLNEITTYDIRFYLSIKREKDGCSNRTLDGMRRCYSSFFSWLSTEGHIPSNPCASLSQIKYKKSIKKPYSAIEMEKLRKSCGNNIRNLALVDFLYSTGCRVSEVTNLDISDVDFDNMQCTVLGKGNKERIVYLSEVAMMHLKEYISSRKYKSNALFVGKGGKRLGKNGIESLLRTLGKKACVENVHPHRFRRTLATNMLDRNVAIQDVATILGHADLKTTQVYCYISQKNVENAYRKFIA